MDDRPDAQFEQLLDYLKEERGFDFSGYKRQSLMRRVRRQMASVEVAGFDEYQDFLAVNPDEFTALFNTVLINVTSFFRDADSWDFLRREVVPPMVTRGHGPIRVWSAGCSTGEEAYSAAMVLADALGPDDFRDRVKIYATDVDEEALAKARSATYLPRELRGLDDAHVDRYFEQTPDGQHAIRKDLRRAVIFGRNDLVQDAPISHIDLLICRNALMYFNAETQGRIIRRLHFALRPSGTLFLGKAEMLLSHVDLFTPQDLKRRFFRKAGAGVPERRAAIEPSAPTPGGSDMARLRDEALLSAPAAQVVVAASGELVASNRRAEALFGISARDVGRPFQDLEVSYKPLELRSAIQTAMAERRSVWEHDVEWQRPGHEGVSLDVQVVPLVGPDSEPLGATVIFNDVTRYRHLQQELQFANRQLEAAFEELQSTNEELETTNEELQSTVEELETTNEELQSTNEELETMNEELQSMNDELNASNEELRLRTVQVSELNDLMESVLSSLRAGVAVVDVGMKVLAWNAGAIDLWGLREDEAVGHSLADLDIGMPLEPLLPLVRQQLVGDAADSTVRVSAVNRRGRTVEVDVTITALRRSGAGVSGAILVMMLGSD
ncbi:PAS domain-containing protein [Cellulomonas fimi]|uniref:CheR family methyltransferase n=1 Tax=Cellulomonas fimi TaxID=1708 RepID=UPI00234C3AA7|nr:CheR family methyltransferase [Cellulomonas fimi]MDC7122759.1 PAS domain-containing protein [Cellulomonas fimi]